jgi:hypothetical protein
MNEQIEARIKELTLERKSLEISHNALVEQNQKVNQEFQQQVLQNQTRFAQITGAITELQKLIKPKGENNNDNLPTTLNLDHRPSDVCVGR